MQFFHLRENQYIICLRKRYSWQSFRSKARVVPGTYSEIFIQGLYSSVFEGSINLKHEYRNFYKNEYENIGLFLFWRYGVSGEIQKKLEIKTNDYLVIFTMNWQIEDDDILRESFIKLFKDLEGQ